MKKVFLGRDVETVMVWCAVLGFGAALCCAYLLYFPPKGVPVSLMWLGIALGLGELVFVVRSVYFEKSEAAVVSAGQTSA